MVQYLALTTTFGYVINSIIKVAAALISPRSYNFASRPYESCQATTTAFTGATNGFFLACWSTKYLKCNFFEEQWWLNAYFINNKRWLIQSNRILNYDVNLFLFTILADVPFTINKHSLYHLILLIITFVSLIRWLTRVEAQSLSLA